MRPEVIPSATYTIPGWTVRVNNAGLRPLVTTPSKTTQIITEIAGSQ